MLLKDNYEEMWKVAKAGMCQAGILIIFIVVMDFWLFTQIFKYLKYISNVGKIYSSFLLGIVPSPGKGSQWRNATGKTRGMPPVGIWSTGEPVVSSKDDEQDNNNV